MSRITATSQGRVGELLFALYAIAGSHGAVKPALPMLDDEGRDVEVHPAGRFRKALAVQVKTSHKLHWNYGQQVLQMDFTIDPKNMISTPRYWYFFAHLDMDAIAFDRFTFLVPSKIVHAHVAPRWRRGARRFQFMASLRHSSHDRWVPYRVAPGDVGKRLMSLLHDLQPRRASLDEMGAMSRIPRVCWLGG